MKRLPVIFSIIMVCLYFSGCSNSVNIEPNELPGTTNIFFEVPEKTHVKLWIENAYQTTVLVLVDEEKAEGVYSVLLEMIDENGNPLPEGIYTRYTEIDNQIDSVHMVYFIKEDA